MYSDTYTRGLQLLEEVHGGHVGEGMVKELGDISPDFLKMTVEWGFGEILSRKGLDLRTRELVIIASCITLGYAMPQLHAHIEAALNVGCTQEEIIEVIIQMAIYAGFAAASNAMRVAKDVFVKSKK